MAQNNNIVVYALLPAGGAQQPPAGQTYHLPPFTLVGEYCHRRPDRQSISAHKLAMGVPHNRINKPPPEYLCWRDDVKDQMLATGYISDNWHFPDAEFQQILEGMRRLKPACDELATASAANNMASMQEIDEAVLQLVKDCGKKLANTIRTNNYVPPPGSGVPPAQVIVRPMLLPLNAQPQCQWSIATAVVPNAGQCSWASPKRTCSPGECPSSEHCQTTERWPMLLGQPKTYLLHRRIPKLRTLPHHQARPIPKLRTILHPPARLIPYVGLVSVCAISTGRKMRTNQRLFLSRSNRVSQWAFWVHATGYQTCSSESPRSDQSARPRRYTCANPSRSPNGHSGYATGYQTCSSKSRRSDQSAWPRKYTCANPSGFPNGYSWETNGDGTCSSGGYPGSRGIEREDPLIQSFAVARRVRRAVSGLSQISESFSQ